MKKNLWVLLALSALIAMFVIAGCAPKPTPSPTPTPTTSPTAPPADTKCPEVVSTEVVKTFYDVCNSGNCDWKPVCSELYPTYSTNCCDVNGKATGTGAFKIIITFNENIDPIKSSCVLNPANWVIEVTNPDRKDNKLTLADGDVSVLDVKFDGKKIIVTAAVLEEGSNTVYVLPRGRAVTFDYFFCGLICNSDDAKSYADVVNGKKGNVGITGAVIAGEIKAPTVADEVYWKLNSGCVVSDELGNWCCDFDGKDCCVEPICETCAPCPLEGSICQ
jgi:hypothetical protein